MLRMGKGAASPGAQAAPRSLYKAWQEILLFEPPEGINPAGILTLV